MKVLSECLSSGPLRRQVCYAIGPEDIVKASYVLGSFSHTHLILVIVNLPDSDPFY